MRTRLPSSASLRAFEAVARHRSFTRAASELNLSQTAVSHQIKALERQLGTQLFHREPNGISLTHTGRDYIDRIASALFEIAEATDRVVERRDETVLVVACLGTYSIKCLLPRLHSFRSLHPDIKLRLEIIDTFDRLDVSNHDVGIRYGVGEWPSFQVDRLTYEECFPVCRPDLVRPGDDPRRSLEAHTAIRLDSRMLRDFWPVWLQAAGLKDVSFQDEVRCNRLSTSIQAAIEGVGFAIARTSVVQPDLDAGLLIAPFPLRVDAGEEGYFIVAPPDCARMRKVEAFRSWALETLAPSTRQSRSTRP